MKIGDPGLKAHPTSVTPAAFIASNTSINTPHLADITYFHLSLSHYDAVTSVLLNTGDTLDCHTEKKEVND